MNHQKNFKFYIKGQENDFDIKVLLFKPIFGINQEITDERHVTLFLILLCQRL